MMQTKDLKRKEEIKEIRVWEYIDKHIGRIDIDLKALQSFLDSFR